MTEPPVATVPDHARGERRLRVVWWLLLGLNVVVLARALPPLLRGDEELYLNQHARLVASAVSGLMLCGGFLAREALRIVFVIAACAAIVVSVWLASGYAQ